MFFFHCFIEGQMTKGKGVGRSTQILDYLENRRYWKLQEEAEDREKWEKVQTTIPHGHKEEIQALFHNSVNLLTSSMLNNNNNYYYLCTEY